MASPLGWECRSRLIKQVPLKPTERRPTSRDGFVLPGPATYDPPQIFCGRGFSKIKRAPAFTFGLRTPLDFFKPAAKPNAPVFNIRNMYRKGIARIPQGKIAERCWIPGDRTQKPGPGQHSPKDFVYLKRPPAYSMRIAAKPPYQPWDQWTPPPNMYWPPIPEKKSPAYSLGKAKRYETYHEQQRPSPNEYNIDFAVVMKTTPAYSFQDRYPTKRPIQTPAPNEHCHKRYLYNKPTAPAPSFGIRHSPYLGKQAVYEKPPHL